MTLCDRLGEIGGTHFNQVYLETVEQQAYASCEHNFHPLHKDSIAVLEYTFQPLYQDFLRV